MGGHGRRSRDFQPLLDVAGHAGPGSLVERDEIKARAARLGLVLVDGWNFDDLAAAGEGLRIFGEMKAKSEGSIEALWDVLRKRDAFDGDAMGEAKQARPLGPPELDGNTQGSSRFHGATIVRCADARKRCGGKRDGRMQDKWTRGSIMERRTGVTQGAMELGRKRVAFLIVARDGAGILAGHGKYRRLNRNR